MTAQEAGTVPPSQVEEIVLSDTFVAVRDMQIYEPLIDEETGDPVLDEAGSPVSHLVTIHAGTKIPQAADWEALDSLIRNGVIERQKDADGLALIVNQMRHEITDLKGRVTALEQNGTGSTTPTPTRARKVVRKSPTR